MKNPTQFLALLSPKLAVSILLFGLLCCGAFSGTLSAQVSKTNNTAGTASGGTIARTVNFVSGVDFPGGSTLSDVDISITWDDPTASGFGFAEEIYFALTSPSGSKVVLVYDVYNLHGRGAAITGTYNGFADLPSPVTVVFDQQAANVVGVSGPGGSDPVSGTFRPEVKTPADNLNILNGQTPFGTWTLTIGDGAAGSGDVGFSEFTLTLSTPAPSCTVGSITSDPSNTSLCATGTAQFSIAHTGTVDSIRWFQAPGTPLSNGGNVSGANGTTLTLSNVATGMNGNQYFARIYACNPVQSAQSANATLTVFANDPPNITTDPVDQTACSGDPVSFNVVASGLGLSYQWQQFIGGSFQDIAGAIAPTLNLTAINLHNGRQYRCVVSGTCSPPDISAVAQLNVIAAGVNSVTRTNTTGGCFENICSGTSQTVDFSGTTGGQTVDSVVVSIEFSTTFTSCTPAGGLALNGEIGFELANNTTGSTVDLVYDDQGCINGTFPVSTFSGTAGVSNVMMTFTDNASTAANSLVNPATGVFAPESALAAFAGQNPEGTWTLRSVEAASSGKLILHNWSVTIYYGGSQGCCPALVSSPIAIDGNTNEILWDTLASPIAPSAGFNNGTVVGDILYHSTCDTLYLAVRSNTTNTTSDGMGFWLDLSNKTGVAAGTGLGFNNGNAHYIGNTSSPFFIADFEVDYLFAWNTGSNSNNLFVDAAEAGSATQFLGNIGQSGNAAVNQGSGVFSTGSVRMAYNGDTCRGGVEFAIPWSELGGIADSIRGFAFEVSGTGFFSDQTVPGNASSNPGSNPDFRTVSGGPFHSAFAATGDFTNPTVSCPSNVSAFTSAGNCTASVTGIGVQSAADNCGVKDTTYALTGATTGSGTLDASGTSFSIGVTTVTYTVMDGAGNSGACAFTVTVSDSIAPTATCQDLTLVLDGTGTSQLFTSQVDNGSADACGIVSFALSDTSFNCTDVGTNSVTLTVTDLNGNIDSCSSSVTVQDTLLPVVSCRDTTVSLDAMGAATIAPALLDNGSSDVCGIASLALSQSTFGCSDVGAKSVTLIVTDNSGNIDSCSSTLTITDPNGGSASITGLDSNYCGNDSIVTMSGTPPGGTFSGNGVSGGSFDPSAVTAGSHTISYSVPASQDYSVTSTTFSSTNISGGTSVSIATNGATGGLPIGFPFEFYGTTYTLFGISSSGFINFQGLDVGCCSGQLLPNASTPNAVVALAWERYVPGIGAAGGGLNQTGYQTIGTTPNRVLIVSFDRWSHNGSVNQLLSGQIKLFEGSNTIEVHVSSMGSDGGIHTLGIENQTGTLATVPAGRNQFTTSLGAEAWLFSPPMQACPSLDSFIVNVNPAPDASYSGLPIAICENQGSVTLVPIVSGGTFSGPGITDSTFNPAAAGSGNHTITYAITDGNSCSNSSSAQVLVNEPPTATIIGLDAEYCPNAADDSISGLPTGGTFSGPGISGTVFSPVGAGLGTHSILYVASDGNGCVDSVTQSTQVIDTIAPIAICSNLTLHLGSNGTVSLNASQVDNGSNDACGIATLSINDTLFGCIDVGLNMITLSVTDNSGNPASCISSVTVVDTIPPVAICKDITVQLDGSGNVLITAAEVDSSSNDACGISGITISDTSFACSNVGANTVTLTVTDNNTNQSTCTATVTVSDTIPPVAICRDITIQLNGSGTATASATNIDSSSNDACGISGIILSDTSFACSDVGANTVTLTVTDNNGNPSTCTATVTVMDTIPPVAVCQDITVQLDGSGNASIVAADVDSSSNDACGISGIAVSDTSFACSDVGANTVTLTVTDNNGNQSTCTSTVTVSDTIPPVAVCQDITVQLDGSGNASIVAADVDSSSNDACGISGIAISDTSFTCADVGANTVTLTVTDNNGNQSTCTATVTIEDSIPPVAICQDITIQLDGSGSALIVAANVDSSSNDACGISGIEVSDTSFACADIGSNTVTLTVTDNNGNQSTCTATVTIMDTIPPAAVCQDITVQLDGSGNASITAADVDSSSNDACGISGIAISDTSFTCADVGANTVTLTVTDNNGNQSTCTSTVTVSDTIPPVAICQDITIQLDGSGNVSITAADVDSSSNDACGISGIAISDTSFTCADVGANTVTLTVTDNNGNQSTCGAVVTIEDSIPPVAICQDITVQLDGLGNATIAATDIDSSSNDACGISGVAVSDTSFTCADVGSNTVTLTVTDNNGNQSTCTSTVTVMDTIPPVAICQDITVQLDGSGNASITAGDVDSSSNDACGISGIAVSDTSFACSDVGANTVTLTVTDNNGNQSTCTATATIMDTIPPVAICQDITVQLDGSGNATIAATDIDSSSNDACGISGVAVSDTSFACADVGSNTVILTVTDNNGNQSTCTATVTVMDTIPPAAVCQDITVQLDGSGNASIVAADVDSSSNDACGISGVAVSDTSFACADVGANTVTLTVTDNNGNQSTCTSTVTVSDTIPPVAICQDITVQLDGSGNASIVAADVDSSSNDACGISGIAISDTSFTCADVGANTVTLTVTDNNGNQSTCGAVVTIEDSIPPVAICQDITIQLDAAGSATIIAADVDSSSNDACGISGIAVSDTSFSCTDIGSNTVILTVTDNNGNQSTCTATVTVMDTIPPAAVCQDITVQLDGSGNASIVAADVDSSSNDACGISGVAVSDTSFACADVGANTVTLTVTDNNGNQSTCTSTVTVSDTIPPVAICQDITVQLDGSGNASIVAADVDSSSNDACGISGIAISDTSFTCADVGANTVTLTVTDNNGNQSTCGAVVTIEDSIPPVAICQDITIQLNAAGSATIIAADVDSSSNDACGISGIAVSDTSFSCTDIGSNTVTLTVTDNNGNQSTCTATVTVMDTIPPAAVCQDITVQLDGSGNASITAADVDSSSNDACGISGIAVSDTSFACSDVGANTVTLTVTDNNGNQSTCTSTVTVSDTIPPVAICQDITVQLDGSGNASIVAADVDSSSNDACGISGIAISDTSFTCADVGANTVTLTVTDNNGNQSTCGAVITIEDSIPPVAICQDITIQLDAAGSATIIAADVDSSSNDACGISGIAVSDTSFTCADVGANTVTLTVTDNNGNQSTCTSTVTVSDTIPPVAICQDITVQLDGSGNASIAATDIDSSSNDACGIAGIAISDTSFTCADIGANTVTLTVTDNNGNQSTCGAVVTIEDSIPPVAICQDITVQLDGSGNATIAATDIDSSSNDACGLAGIAVSDTSFACADVGANTVTLTVTDNNGNQSTCTATVTVMDTVPPVAVCQDITVQLDAAGLATIIAADVDSSSNDACGISGIAVSDTSFACSDVGANTVTLTVTDNNGNQSTCTSTVTVSDTIPPVAICQDITVQLDGSGNASIAATDIDSSSNDACGIAGIAISDTSFTCADIGANTVTLTVTDNNGNQSTCGAVVTIEDSIPPVAICQDITVQLDGSGNATIAATDIDSSSNDACGIAGIAVSDTSFACADVGANTVTLTVTDNNGNQSTCTATVTVMDTVPPVAVCQDITVQLDAAGLATIIAADVDSSSNDACGISGIAVSDTSFACSDVGANTVTLTVTDNNGNQSTCTSTVTVSDTIPPVAICQDITVQLDGSGNASIAATDIDSSSNDACGLAGIAISDTSFACGDIGANTVTLTVTDNNGNQATCTATVTVMDTIPPVAICQDITVQLDGSGNALIAATDVDSSSNDACGIAGIAVSDTSFACADVGANTVTLTVTDNNGNQSTCTATVTVMDTVPPVAVCQDITVQLDAAGLATIIAADVDSSSNDACGISGIAVSDTSFACSDVGANTVTLTVTDNNGNTSTCGATVTIEDTVPPVAICRDITVQLDGSGNASIAATDIDSSSSDACGIAGIAISDTSFACADVGANTVTLTVTDNNGNQATCTETVTVMDTIPPVASCQDITVQLDGSGNALIAAADVDSSSNDACGIANLAVSDTSFACADVGANTVTLTVTDNNGNQSTCTSTVTVMDTIPPVAVCQDITVQLDAIGSATITAADVDSSSNDACGISGIAVSDTSFSCADVGANTVTLTVTDNNGNTSTCGATVTIEDTVPPVAICQDITVQLDGSGNASIAATDIDSSSNDACGIAGIAISDTSFACADVGANTVTLTVTDNNGNQATCTATVTVMDTIPPVASCQDITVQLDAIGSATIIAADVDSSSNDACGIANLAVSDTSFACANVGANTVTLTVTDNNGNQSTCTSTVTVMDTIPPVAVCQDITVQLDAIGSATITAADVDSSSNDACGIAGIAVSDTSFTCADVGTNTVTLTVTDNNGNQSTCTATVTVMDTIPPVALCQDLTVQLDTSGNVSILPAQVDNGSNDACGLDTLTLDISSFTCANLDTNTVTLTVPDVNGNSSTCTAIITIEDTIAPTALCQNETVHLDANGAASLLATDLDGGSTDNCTIDSIVASQTSFSCSDLGSNTITVTFTDQSGNVSTCTSTVTVLDTIAPVIVGCPVDTTIAADSANCAPNVIWTAPTASDNCSVISLVSTFAPGDTFQVGTTLVTYVAADTSGNTDTCTFTITVTPDTFELAVSSPTFACGTNISCNGDSSGSITASASGGCLPYSYVWNTGDTTATISNLTAGTYSVTATDSLGNTVLDSITLSEPVALATSITGNFLTCVGDSTGSIDLTVTGGADCANYLYLWSTGDTTEDLTGLMAGTYTVLVTDTNGCTITDSATITEYPLAVVNIGPDTSICREGNLLLDAGAGFAAYQWSTGATTDTTRIDTAGTYWVVVTDTNGCSATDSVLIDYYPVPVVNLGADTTICEGDTILLDAGGPFASYSWSIAGNDSTLAVALPDTYIVYILDSNGCAGTDTLVVSQFVVADPIFAVWDPIPFVGMTRCNWKLILGCFLFLVYRRYYPIWLCNRRGRSLD